MGSSSLRTTALLVLSFIVALFFWGCSTKEVFEPENVSGNWEKTQKIDADIIDKTADAALLENGNVLVGDKQLDITVQKGFRIVGAKNGYVITTDIDGHLRLYNVKTKEKTGFDLKKTVAAASTDGDVVAIVFASGDIALYALSSKTLLIKIEGASSIAVDARIVNPYFMDDLVLFMTLDGKVVIVNKRLKKRLRTIIVSAAEYFNNVIYFDILDEKLIVATAKKILSFGSSEQRLEIEARNITHEKKHLYVGTKQGDIIVYAPNLKELHKVHFPFAHFLALSVIGEKVYALEKEGYLIELSKDLLTYKIYEVDLSDEGYVYQGEKRFVVDNEAILLEDGEATK